MHTSNYFQLRNVYNITCVKGVVRSLVFCRWSGETLDPALIEPIALKYPVGPRKKPPKIGVKAYRGRIEQEGVQDFITNVVSGNIDVNLFSTLPTLKPSKKAAALARERRSKKREEKRRKKVKSEQKRRSNRKSARKTKSSRTEKRVFSVHPPPLLSPIKHVSFSICLTRLRKKTRTVYRERSYW